MNLIISALCPFCGADRARCPECGDEFDHGSHWECPNDLCLQYNAPLDCVGCGRTVACGARGVLDFDQSFKKYKENRDE